MFDQLQSLEDRYEELGELLSDPEVVSDTKRFMELSKEEASTRETVEVYRRYKDVIQGIADSEELLSEKLDDELQELAKEELSEYKAEKEELEEKLKFFYYLKTLMMIKILLWKLEEQPVEMKQLYLLVIYLKCIKVTHLLKVGNLK